MLTYIQEKLKEKYSDLIPLIEAEYGPGVKDPQFNWKYDWQYFSLVEEGGYGRTYIELTGPYEKLKKHLNGGEANWVYIFDYKATTQCIEVKCPKKACKIIIKYLKKLDNLCKIISEIDKSLTT